VKTGSLGFGDECARSCEGLSLVPRGQFCMFIFHAPLSRWVWAPWLPQWDRQSPLLVTLQLRRRILVQSFRWRLSFRRRLYPMLAAISACTAGVLLPRSSNQLWSVFANAQSDLARFVARLSGWLATDGLEQFRELFFFFFFFFFFFLFVRHQLRLVCGAHALRLEEGSARLSRFWTSFNNRESSFWSILNFGWIAQAQTMSEISARATGNPAPHESVVDALACNRCRSSEEARAVQRPFA